MCLVNRCLQEEIGFGRYQIELFLLSGLGWMADSLLPCKATFDKILTISQICGYKPWQ